MEKTQFSPRTVRFGVFEIDLAAAELRKGGSRVRIQEQPFKVLAALLERPGEVIPREELVRRLWPDGTFVDFDRGLNAAVTRLRQALADSAENPRYVETVARRGYRFLSHVETVSSSTAAEADAASRRLKMSSVHRNWWIALASAALLLLIVTTALVIPRKQRETRFEQITRDPGLATAPAVSPDGKLLAYASDRGAQNLNVWVRQLAPGGKAVQLTHEDSDAHQPWFSPDGTTIVYRSERDGGGLYVIPSIGGEPKRIVAGGRNARYSPDGASIAYWDGAVQGSAPDGDASGNIFVVPVSGGQPRRLGPNLPPAGDPIWSPDSTQLLVCGNPPGISAAAADWWIVPIDGTTAKKTGAFDALRLQGFFLPFGLNLPHAAAWANGEVTFSAQKGDSRNIWRVPFHAGALSGTARRLTEGTTLEVFPSIAADGSLIFASLNRNAAIWALPLTATATEAARQPQRLTDGSTSEATPSISADGRMLVYGATIPNHEDIWLKDLRTERETAIAASSAAEWHPAISRDGSMIAYTVDEARQHGMLVISTTGGKPKWVGNVSGWIFDWSPDKQYLLFHPKASPDPVLRRLDVRSGVVSAYLSKPGVSLFQAKFSPDGNWLAFEGVIQSGDSQLFVVRVVNGAPVAEGEWIRVGDENGWSDKPRWSPDGNALIFLSDRDGFRCIWRQRLDPASKHPIGVPEPFHHFHESRLSPRNVGLGLLEMDVAKDKIAINLGELTGNIWSLRGR